MTFPKRLAIITASHMGEAECRNVEYSYLSILSVSEVFEALSRNLWEEYRASGEVDDVEPDLYEQGDFALEDDVFATVFNSMTRNYSDYDYAVRFIEPSNMSDSDMLFLAELELNGEDFEFDFPKGSNIKDYTSMISDNLRIATRRVIAFNNHEHVVRT